MQSPPRTETRVSAPATMADSDGVASRQVALDALARIDDDGAYANLVLSGVLDRPAPSGAPLSSIDKGFVTDLVYGTVRMQRALDFLVDRFLTSDPPPAARRALRLGAYQLAFRDDLPDYAVVSATVSAAPKRFRGLVNAVLRKVATAPVDYPDDATRLSYPDWIVEQLVLDLGEQDALGALEAMDRAPSVHRRADGYVQDLASQWVAELVGARPGERVADLCAAPGGKATAMAATGATVIAADLHPARVGLIRANTRSVRSPALFPVVADGLFPALRPGPFDRVLLYAPCSGLGVLRRRADARWRVDPAAPERLGTLATRLIDAAVPLVGPGGTLVFSVCTLTAAESLAVDEHVARTRPELQPLPAPGAPWKPWGRGAILLPQAADTDGMCVFGYLVPAR